MITLYIRNEKFEKIGRPITQATSVVWLRKFMDAGQCAFNVEATPEMLDLLRYGRFVTRDDDEMVTIIKQITIITNSETNMNEFQVVALDVLNELNNRHTYKLRTFDTDVKSAIGDLIEENVLNPVVRDGVLYTARRMPISIGSLSQIDNKINVELKVGTYILDQIKAWCNDFDFGMSMKRVNDKFQFNLHKGVNRAYGQSVNPYVVFSEQFHNLKTTNYIQDGSNYKNTAYVVGAEDIIEIVNDDLSGFNRKELFVDASSLSREDENKQQITEENYRLILQQHGITSLNGSPLVETFSGEVLNTRLYKYKTHFFIGDIVTIKNKIGLTFNARITQVKEAYDINGEDITLTLEYREVI